MCIFHLHFIIELSGTHALILKNVLKWNLPIEKLRGQGYDGCSTMSGEVSGVQKRIKTIHPAARYYVH